MPPLQFVRAATPPAPRAAWPRRPKRRHGRRTPRSAICLPPSLEVPMSNPLVELEKTGQSVWYDQMERKLVTGGVLQRLIDEDDLRGLTSNPTIFDKAIA